MAKALCILFTALMCFASAVHAQKIGTITVKKEKSTESSYESADHPMKQEYMRGLFYSAKMKDERVHNPKFQFLKRSSRYYFYFLNDKEVCFFRSRKKPRHHFNHIHSIPMKLLDEIGEYEIYGGELYIEMKSVHSNQIFRYTGQANSKQIWLGSRSAYQKKMQLDVYLTKCTDQN